MTSSAAVPFVIRRVHEVVSGREVTATREDSHGLLHLEAGQLVAQWSTAREISRAGKEIRVDRALGPVQVVAVPLSGLAGARVRWRMFPWPPRWQLILRAADLHAFRALAGEAALLLEHPAELVLDLRRVDRAVARAFAAELELALAEAALQAAEDQPRLRAAEPERSPTGRPVPGEYADYASTDIAAVPGDDAIEALTQLAEPTTALFRGLAEPAARGLTYAPGKWTLKEVLGHLIDDERIFAYRVLCVARGEEGELPGFDENRYAAQADFEGRSLDSLLAEYAVVRRATVALLQHLPPAAWARRGRVNGYAASVRGLAFHIAGHELHHHRVVRERYLPLLG